MAWSEAARRAAAEARKRRSQSLTTHPEFAGSVMTVPRREMAKRIREVRDRRRRMPGNQMVEAKLAARNKMTVQQYRNAMTYRHAGRREGPGGVTAYRTYRKGA